MIVLLMWISCSVFCYFVMKSKGYPSDKCWVHCAGGFLLGIIWLIVVLCKNPYSAPGNEVSEGFLRSTTSLSQMPVRVIPQRADTSAEHNSNSNMEREVALQILERMADLKNKGVLTEEEFYQKKAELLRII